MRSREEIEEMLEENLQLVPLVISRRFPTFICDDDIFQIGYIGLWQACKNYDPERNTKFSTYAFWAIQGEIIKHFRSLQMKKRCPPEPPLSLDYPVLDDDKTVSDRISGELFDWIDFGGFYSSLSKRQKKIVEMRIKDNATYQEIGDCFGISRERIRQEMVKVKEKFDKYI